MAENENKLEDKVLEQAKSRLVQALKPKKIYLFGSRGRGDHAVDSDYDLLVLVDDSPTPRFQRELDARASLRGLGASFDVFVYTKQEFEAWKNELSSIPETATFEGRELDLG